MVLAVPLCSYTEEFTLKILSVPFYEIKGMSLIQSHTEYDLEGMPYFVYAQTIYDEKGIPFYNYSNMIGIQRNPEVITYSALDYEKKYVEGNESCKNLFLNCADWLENNTIEHDNYSLWEVTFNSTHKEYNMSPPWRSGLGQAHGIEILAKAYRMTGDEKYLKKAQSLANLFFIDTDDGGVTYKDKDGWWYEEYADQNGSEPRVLNGMMFTLSAIYEFYNITGDEKAKFLFERGVSSLRNHLSDYDAGYWTYYDIHRLPADKSYHHVHVVQLKRLYQLTNDQIFLDYYNKWRRYESGPEKFLYKFMLFHDKLSLLIYGINSMAIFLGLSILYYQPIRPIKRSAKRG